MFAVPHAQPASVHGTRGSVTTPQNAPGAQGDDVQALVRVNYAGDLALVIATELKLDYPTANFVSLPVTLTLTAGTVSGARPGGRLRLKRAQDLTGRPFAMRVRSTQVFF